MNKKQRRAKRDVWTGIKELENRKEAVIRPADKGGGIVILKNEDYNKELNRLVSDTSTYEKLKHNPTTKYRTKCKKFLKKAHKEGILNKKEYRYLLPGAPKLPVIYRIPKVHKNQTMPPGRPIISGIDSLISQIGEYLDIYLQPLAQQYPAFLWNSKQLINMLEDFFELGITPSWRLWSHSMPTFAKMML